MSTYHRRLSGAALATLAFAFAAVVWAGDTAEPEGGHHDATAMPGHMHEKMAGCAGSYTTSTKLWMEPGAEPMVTAGTATLEMAVDGRFLLERNSGDFMGQKTDGLRVYGFNTGTNMLEAVWTYSHSTAMLTFTGTCPEGSDTITMTGSWAENVTTRENVWATMRHVDDDHFVVTMYSEDPATATGPVMEMTYTRTK